MQTILGANGIIAKELSNYLLGYTANIRQVSRHPKKVNVSDETVVADLLNPEQTDYAVKGSEVVYLVAGLKYDTKVWKAEWPVVMKNVIEACKKHNSRLVFFDNVYAYGKVNGIMIEETPFNPNSVKGEVRAKIASLLLDEIKRGNLRGMIVRAADFYGPEALMSLTHTVVHERLRKGKSPQWIGDPGKIHTFTYTPDAGRTLAILGNSDSAFNQTWHALTSHEKITGEEYIRKACRELNRPFDKIQSLPKFGVRLLGLFVPVLREFVEMMYQFEGDYIFDSGKLEKAFELTATPYTEGIKQTLSR
ncbi:MAG: NAD-dependent dehydratase [Marivirga sp.]|nr:NAD-dependent dehydratase [Marivirga sp.]